jgi:excisionase family DNA binding protein
MSTSRFQLDHPALRRAASIQEVSDFLGVTKRHVERQICAGRIRATKVPRNGAVQVLPAALISYLEANARIPEAGQPCDLVAMKILMQALLAAERNTVII